MKILAYMYDSNNKSDMQKTPYKYGVPNVITNGANRGNRNISVDIVKYIAVC